MIVLKSDEDPTIDVAELLEKLDELLEGSQR
jgi:hypothetical protein